MPLTVADALSIISPTGIGGTVNAIVHEHDLNVVYDALRFLQKAIDAIPEKGKGAWSTVAL